LLGTVETNGRVVVADFEAGIGTLTRLGEGDVDVVLVVVEPTPKSIEVGVRCADLAREKSLGRVVVLASRTRDAADLEMIASAFPGCEIVAIPYDEGIRAADRDGIAPIDLAPDGAAVNALVDLAARLPGS
jgi:CO dehydrogenase maturation factor